MSTDDDESREGKKWSTGAKVGAAAIGSAALVAALLYAGKRHKSQKKGKLEPMSPDEDEYPAGDNHPVPDID